MADEVAEYRYLETHKERVYMRLIRLDTGLEEKLLIPRKVDLGSIEQNCTVRVRSNSIFKEGIRLKFIKSLSVLEQPFPRTVPIECLLISKEVEHSQVSFRDSKNSKAFDNPKHTSILDEVDMDVLELELLDLSHFKSAKKPLKPFASSSSAKKPRTQKKEPPSQHKPQLRSPVSKLGYQDLDLDLDYIEALIKKTQLPDAAKISEEALSSTTLMPAAMPKAEDSESIAELISQIEYQFEQRIAEIPDNIDSLINPPVPLNRVVAVDSSSSTICHPLHSSLTVSDGSNLSCNVNFGQTLLSNSTSLAPHFHSLQASQRPKEVCKKMDEECRPTKLSALVAPTTTSNHKNVLTVRVSQVYPIKTIQSLKKDYFMCELLDQSGSIPCVVEGKLVGDRFLLFEQEAVLVIKKYCVRKGQKSKDKRMKDVELKIDDSSEIEPAVDDGSIPSLLKFSFSQLADLTDKKEGFTFDLACIVVGISKKVDLPLKAGGTTQRQVFKVVDDSDFEGELTIWRDLRHSEKISLFDLVVFRKLKVNIFRGKNLCNSLDTSVIISPRHQDPRIAQLRRYHQAFTADPHDGHHSLKEAHITDHQPQTLIRIAEAAALLEANPEQEAKVFSCIAIVRGFKGNLTYSKCPNSDCYKSVVVDSLIPDLLTCDGCGLLPQASKPVQRYIGSIELVDGTASIWCLYSKESVGRALFGDCTAEEVYNMRMKDMSYFRSMMFQMANRELKFWIQPTYSKDKRLARMAIKYEIKRVERWSTGLLRELLTSIKAEAERKLDRMARKKEAAARSSATGQDQPVPLSTETYDGDRAFDEEFL